jgi:hypothetical protein
MGWYQIGTLSAAMNDTTTPSFSTLATTPAISQIFRIDNEIVLGSVWNAPTMTLRKRGDNGSTAATHLNAAPLYVWQCEESITTAVLETANNIISGRQGQSGGRISVTSSGLVIRPEDLSPLAQSIVQGMQKRL